MVVHRPRVALLASSLALLLSACGGDGPGDGGGDAGAGAADGGTGAFTLVSTSPADGAVDVELETTVEVRFSAPCDPATLTTEHFTLSADGAAIDASVTAEGDTATLTPSAPLAEGTTYTATLSAAVAAATGLTLGTDHTWTFSTLESGRPPRFSMEDATFTGAFRIPNGEYGVSTVDYAVGTLGFNPENHSLYIVGRGRESAIAEFPITDPSMATEVAMLPVTDDPIQPFTDVLGTGGNPESLDRVTGILWVDGALLINAEQWYDGPGDNTDTTIVVADADDLAGARDGYFELTDAARSGGYMGVIPARWQEAFGTAHYTGWSSVYSIISRYSIGPSLYAFTPSDLIDGDAATEPSADATAFMTFPFGDGTQLDPRGTEYEPQGTPGPFPPASPLWNPLSRGVYGFFVPGTRSFLVVGSTGGLETGIGYKAEQEDGSICPGPCPYGVDDRYNYYWLFDVDEILAADSPHDPRPYDFGVWEVPFDDGGAHPISGATFDAEGGVLYLALDNAGQVGTYDRPPLIVTYTLR